MRKSSITILAVSLFVLVCGGAMAQAGQVKVELITTSIVREFYLAQPEGFAYVDLARGLVKVRLRDLPTDTATGACQPISLTDYSTSPPTVGEAVGYVAWLLRVELIDGQYTITDGQDLGTIKVQPDCDGTLELRKGGDLTGYGFNLVAVTAEASYEHADWIPEASHLSFSWRGANGVIVMWGALEHLP
jgi:hypothetical protein